MLRTQVVSLLIVGVALVQTELLGQVTPQALTPVATDHQSIYNAQLLGLGTGHRRDAEYMAPSSDLRTVEQSLRDSVNRQVAATQSRRIMTRDGRVVFQFQNYDISIGGTPEFAGQGNGTGQTDAISRQAPATRIIWKGNQGSSWDGSSFFRSSNYNDSYARNYYARGVLGQPGKQWTATIDEGQANSGCPDRSMMRTRFKLASTRVSTPAPTKSLATLNRKYAEMRKSQMPMIPLRTYGQASKPSQTRNRRNDQKKSDVGKVAPQTDSMDDASKTPTSKELEGVPLRQLPKSAKVTHLSTRSVNAKYLESLRKMSGQ